MTENPIETTSLDYDVSEHARWTDLGLVAGLFILILAVLYGAILRDLVRQWWEDDNYSHGFLVPLFRRPRSS